LYAEQVLTHPLSTSADRLEGGGGGSRPEGGSLRWACTTRLGLAPDRTEVAAGSGSNA